jgi:hypothetical protein
MSARLPPAESSFRDEVLRRFLPLLAAFDFRATHADDHAVRVGRFDDPEPPFELADVVRATDCPPARRARAALSARRL